MRRHVALVAVLLLTVLTLRLHPALAQGFEPAGCVDRTGYPPRPAAAVQVSGTNPVVGTAIEVSGTHFCPSETVAIVVRGREVASASTDPFGSFDPLVRVPGPAGRATLCVVGASAAATDRACVTLSVRRATPSAASGTTAVTGTEVAVFLAVGLILLAGGIAFATAGRRPTPSVSP